MKGTENKRKLKSRHSRHCNHTMSRIAFYIMLYVMNYISYWAVTLYRRRAEAYRVS